MEMLADDLVAYDFDTYDFDWEEVGELFDQEINTKGEEESHRTFFDFASRISFTVLLTRQ